MALGALSIDLDALRQYRRIHGMADARPASGADTVYTRAVPRFAELCARLGARGTAFCVGEDLSHPEAANAIRDLAAAGHEIGNHTWSHDYALVRRDAATIAAEVRHGAEAVAAACGRRPAGFRAPGYALSAPLLAAAAGKADES
jgi:peptidoglycan-N-acetylglucosamine deacetylase